MNCSNKVSSTLGASNPCPRVSVEQTEAGGSSNIKYEEFSSTLGKTPPTSKPSEGHWKKPCPAVSTKEISSDSDARAEIKNMNNLDKNGRVKLTWRQRQAMAEEQRKRMEEREMKAKQEKLEKIKTFKSPKPFKGSKLSWREKQEAREKRMWELQQHEQALKREKIKRLSFKSEDGITKTPFLLICAHCKTAIDDDEKFCGNCGAKL